MDSTENDDQERDSEETGEAGVEAEAAPTEDPNVPKNRAERRAAAKAARRGRVALLADGTTVSADPTEVAPIDDAGLTSPTTSMGGNPGALAGTAASRRRPPPRTMSKGTGDIEGVPEWARQIGNALDKNRTRLVAAAAAVVIVVGGALGVTSMQARKSARAGDALFDALQTSEARIEAEDAPVREDAPARRGPVFRSFEARARAASDKFRQVEQQNGSSRVAPLARLAEATSLYQLGRYQEARQLYQGLVGADVSGLEASVLEGLAFSLESLNDLDGAAARYRDLAGIQGNAYRDEAQFYLARLSVRRNERDRAKELLHGVIDRTAHPPAADPLSASVQSLREQAVALLREIEPADPQIVEFDRQRAAGGGAEGGEGHGHGAPGANPLESLPPEIRRQLEEAMRKQGRR